MSHASTSCGSAVGAYTALSAKPDAAEDIDPVGDPQQVGGSGCGHLPPYGA